MPAPDPLEVHIAARRAIELHGSRAIEIAEAVLETSQRPKFAKAVLAEIKRLLEETHH